MTTVAPGYAQPPPGQQGYAQPPPGQQQQTVVVGAPQPMILIAETKPDNHICMGVFTCLCCFWPVGFAALIFACMVDSKWEAGDKEGARKASKTASTLWKVALGLGIAGIVIGIIMIPVYLFVIVPAQIHSALNSIG